MIRYVDGSNKSASANGKQHQISKSKKGPLTSTRPYTLTAKERALSISAANPRGADLQGVALRTTVIQLVPYM